ncbi:YggS family pyridoxal phosphate-dependent enzyme [Rapidithrix thailandica]|uniref:Pyridoxal phosphate homeostasis protein n=1 Tax=Rapidithrix thailandica TaxID=413964 RepID=A0AAW9S6W9_9BACT
MKHNILTNLSHVKARVKAACLKAGRDPGSVKLLLATKTVSAENIRIAMEAGESLLGENKVQELKSKYEALHPFSNQLHFIGHLQTNKVKEVIKYATCIQSVDRIRLAEKLQNRLTFEDRRMDVFIQVNTSYEQSKFGAAPENTLKLIQEVSSMDRLKIKGLMTIGLFSAEPEKVRKCFRLLKNLQEQAMALNLPGVSLDELSMGMSGDLEIAIEEGATMVRVGTAIFGKRPYPDSYYWNENNGPKAYL